MVTATTKRVKKTVCRKLQGIAEPGNTCLTTPGTCESCPEYGKIPVRQIYAIEWMNKRGWWETWQTHGPTEQEHKDAIRLCRRARRRFKPEKFRVIRYVPEYIPPKNP